MESMLAGSQLSYRLPLMPDSPGRRSDRSNSGVRCEHAPGALRIMAAALRAVLFFLSVLPILAGCSAEEKKPASRPPAPVSVSTVVRKDVPVQTRAIGQVEAFATVTVTPLAEGELREIHFREGQEVKEGDLLFTIDSRPYQAELNKCRADLAKEEAMLKLFQSEAQRKKDITRQGLVSELEYDRATTQVATQHAVVKSAQSAVDAADLKLSYCRIHAPLSGRTGPHLLNRGNIAKAGQSQLVLIKQFNPCFVSFAIPEKQLPELIPYLTGPKLKLEAFPSGPAGPSETGVLTFVDNQVDRDTGTVALKGTFQNRELRLWPGQFVNAVLTLHTLSDAIVVPSRAIQTGPDGPFVFEVSSDQTVGMRVVEVGPALGSDLVIMNGLGADAVVVTEGHLGLYPGARIVISEGAAPAGKGPSPGGSEKSSAPRGSGESRL